MSDNPTRGLQSIKEFPSFLAYEVEVVKYIFSTIIEVMSELFAISLSLRVLNDMLHQ